MEENKRRLATIQKIVSIEDIPEADKILKATILGWHCVIAKKDNFNVGDLVVYIEVDSIVPEEPQYEFLRPRKFRIRTIRLRQQISQGLILPLSVLPKGVKVKEDLDVTADLKISKYDPQLKEEMEQAAHKKDSKLVKFLKRYAIFRKLFFTKIKKNWPDWLSHTDEQRIQSEKWILEKYKDVIFYVSEKCDGQSFSAFLKDYPYFYGLLKKKVFGVCSRNIWYKTPIDNNYWNIAKKYEIEKKLRAYGKNIAIQGEIIGPKIQANKYGLKELDFYVFNIYDIDKKQYYQIDKMIEACKMMGLKHVPVLDTTFRLKATVDEMVEYSKGMSVLKPDQKREGIVLRPYAKEIIDEHYGRLSFKVISPDFLLENDE